MKSDKGLTLTTHARQRMDSRRIPANAVAAVLDYGRLVRVRAAEVYAIGRKEVARYRSMGVDLRAYEGYQVVCSTDGAVMTVYRNRDFKSLRPRKPTRGYWNLNESSGRIN